MCSVTLLSSIFSKEMCPLLTGKKRVQKTGDGLFVVQSQRIAYLLLLFIYIFIFWSLSYRKRTISLLGFAMLLNEFQPIAKGESEAKGKS